ncbi:SUMO ligase MMS21 [Aspergillus candidus]|uniref:Zinc-finger of the MIZ type in Nse subunit-domain-containing protein n=1 Tax=Aspergillus candidus TaxID=41067 RepID=A0A2I2FKT6_ASPCN|nr:zinc-finger of the MIZ type in Nse subunit-domain-containing protein [Aspergillus candidus]PLB41233.1 zinc-finger of the MIZ type in Nse subunit-domain-containing protein [Aspergillus candidus]
MAPRPRRQQQEETETEAETEQFTYEPPLTTLTSTGHRALLQLLKSQPLRHLKTHLQHAEEKLTDAAGEVNERLTDAHVRYQRLKDRRGSSTRDEVGDGEDAAAAAAATAAAVEGGGNEDEDREKARITKLEDDVRDVTGRLEAQMRETIDAEALVDGLGVVLGRFEDEAERESVAAPVSASTRGSRRTRRAVAEGQEEEEEEDEEEEEEEQEEQRDFVPTSQKLADELEGDHTKWDELSLTERYSTNNAYVGFYRIIHEAKHPGNDIPPLPSSSTWFTHLESPSQSHPQSHQQTSSQSQPIRPRPRSPSPASPTTSDDIAISSEIISLKCPLTLLPFQNPVSSTKCPHSFEREAIESMLSQSQTTVAVSTPAQSASSAASKGSRRGRRARAVKCPVCEELLTWDDFRADAVLVRRVRRAEAARRREEEGDSEEEFVVGGGGSRKRSRRSEITVGSDDEDEEEEQKQEEEQQVVRIKQEKFMSQG